MVYIGRDSKEDAIISRFAKQVSSGKADFCTGVGIDFVFGRRDGPFVWDATSSKGLINCHCNGGVFNRGHRHPRIIDALEQSLRAFDISNHHLISERRALLAEDLAALSGAQDVRPLSAAGPFQKTLRIYSSRKNTTVRGGQGE